MNREKGTLYPNRDFYEQLYSQGEPPNPARDIYNQLRIQVIKDLISDSVAPFLIIGCGSGEDLKIVSKQRTFAFDLSFNAIKQIPKTIGMNLLVADLVHMPFPDDYFTTVICSEVLEHVEDIRLAIHEIYRVIRKNGVLVVSSPNWLSWFGLARWVGEKLLNRPIHSSGQPYDDWKTVWKYRKELHPEFEVEFVRGVWYLPPMHFHGKGLSRSLTRFIYKMFSPMERKLSCILPYFGHLIILKAHPRK